MRNPADQNEGPEQVINMRGIHSRMKKGSLAEIVCSVIEMPRPMTKT
jgi:hypothetical protein